MELRKVANDPFMGNHFVDSSFQALPKNWVWAHLFEIADIVTGATPPKSDPNNYGDFIPLVKPPQLKDSEISSADDYLSEKGASLARIAPANSVFVSCIGSLGKTAINKVPVAFNQQINALVLKEPINPKYVFYYCQTLKNWLYEAASATTLPIVNKSKFRLASMPLAPQPEQIRIVAKIEELFSRLDAGVSSLISVQQQPKAYQQSVLKHAFVGEFTKRWRELHLNRIEPASKLIRQIVSERRNNLSIPREEEHLRDRFLLQQLPDGWAWTTISQVADLISGQHVMKRYCNYSSEGMPYLTGPADFGVMHPTVSKWTTKPKTIARKNDILVTVKGAGVGKANLLDGEEVVISRQLMALRVPHLNPKYVFFFCLANYNELHRLGAGSTVPGIDRKSMLSVMLPLAPREEQDIIVQETEQKLSATTQLKSNIYQCVSKAARLRQGILKAAFAGKLVRQDKNDEPASALLARIMALKHTSKVAEPLRDIRHPKQMELWHYGK